MKTWAVLFPRANEVRFERVEVPPMGDDEVVVESTWSWISNGTEGSFLRGERADGETPASPQRPAPFPIVAGYQRVGTVVAAGAASGYQPGEVVFATMTRLDGLAVGAGGQVHCGPVHRDQVFRLPADGPPPEAYAGLVLTQVGWNCGTFPTVTAGDAAVVIGDGLVGQWSAQTLQQRGARVLLLGRHDSRLARLAQRAGDRAVNTHREDAVAAVTAWAGQQVQAVVDTVGTNDLLLALFWQLRRRGHLVSAGYLGERGAFDIQELRKREASLHAPSGWTRERLEETLAWVHSGRLTTLDLVTHRFPAAAAAAAWEAINTDRDTLGVLLDWREVSA
ncbi:MAG: zinc-binding dehydrogenase [Fimbriimonadaceae bacterium]|nr:zinc-binding dehydrogenase [Fimbriimonadaceae bacterium]